MSQVYKFQVYKYQNEVLVRTLLRTLYSKAHCQICIHLVLNCGVVTYVWYYIVQEALTAQFDSFEIQFSLLERKNTENEAQIADNEAKIRVQAEEINQLKAKLDTQLDYAHNFLGSYNDESILPSKYNNKMNSTKFSFPSNYDGKENSFGESSTRAIAPASCRELALIGHSLDGLYLVKNPDTNKVETVLCNFGTSKLLIFVSFQIFQ